jgi:hypothetical protein
MGIITKIGCVDEFSDKRVASPAIRASYTFTNGFEVDTFMQMFAPTTIVGTNTPYNVVASGFSWSDNTGEFDEAQNTLNFGMRVNMPVTDKLTLGVMAVNRRNPDGVVRWDDAPTTLSDGTANPFCFGPNNAAAAALGFADLADTNNNGIGDTTEMLTPLANGKCGSTAAPDPMGTASWAEWQTMAGKSRLNPIEGTLGFLNGGERNASGTNASTLAGNAAELSIIISGALSLWSHSRGEFTAHSLSSVAGLYSLALCLDSILKAYSLTRKSLEACLALTLKGGSSFSLGGNNRAGFGEERGALLCQLLKISHFISPLSIFFVYYLRHPSGGLHLAGLLI